MTRTRTHDRSPRSQTLCVGLNSAQGNFACDGLSIANDLPTINVDTLFDAIGKLTQSSARQPIDTIIINEPALRNATAQSIESLREIDPAAKLVLVCNANGQKNPLSTLFDSTINAPHTTADATPHTINANGSAAPSPTADLPQPSLSTPENINSPEETEAPPQEDKPVPATPNTPTLPIEIEIQQPIADDVPKHHIAQDEPLGDIDLVESIIHRDDQLLERALRLIIQQTGWNDIVFHNEQTFVDGTAAQVTYNNQAFGMLTTNSTDARSLKPWGDWLARWLALDASHRSYRLQSLRDELTGAWNRRFFNEFLSTSLTRARQLRVPVTIMVFDIDDFKVYNDTYGHHAGDEILVETVRLLESVIRCCDRVCRIGGDEFAVIFADPEGPRAAGSTHPDAVGDIATRFQKQVTAMSFPKLSNEAPGTLTISGGLATYPWDGDNPEQLLRLADQRALRSKRAGKNVITFGPEADETDHCT